MKILIDRRFEHWIDAFNSWNSGGNTILDNAVIGAGIVGTAAGGITARVMNGISASLTGVRTTVNNDFFYQKSVQVIITQMQTDRAKWDTIIEGRLQATQKTGMQCVPPAEPPKVRSQRKLANKPISFSSETVTENEIANTTTTITKTTTQKPASNILPYCNLSEAWSDLERSPCVRQVAA